MNKKSFVMTGYIERSTCNCGCVSNNYFWQDGGFGGSNHLAKLHDGIEKYLDELSNASPGKHGKECDVKVTVTIEKLGEHDHRLVTRNTTTGLGYEDSKELKKDILKAEEPENAIKLDGDEEFGNKKERRKRVDSKRRELSVEYIQDIHDRLLLIKKFNNMDKLDDLMLSLQEVIKSKN